MLEVTPSLFAFALVVLRTTGLLAVAPIFGNRLIPSRVKLALSVFAGAAAYFGAGAPLVPVPTEWTALAFAAGTETMVGLLAGLGARFLLDAAQAAGQAVGLSMGLGFGALIDPSSGAETATVGQLFSVLAVSFAVALGVHREALAWLAVSLREVPPGSAVDLRTLLAGALQQAILAIAMAVRVAFPVLAAVTLGHTVLALLGRVAPQFNLSNIGFSVAILAGGLALFLVAPPAARICAQAAARAFNPGAG